MTLVSLDAAGKSFGGRTILERVDLQIGEDARTGVIGPNGSGKSTLLRLLAGLETPDDGRVVRRRGVSVAFLPQHVPEDDRTPLRLARDSRPDLAALEAELEAVAARLGDPDVVTDLDRMSRVLHQQEELVRRHQAAGGPGFEARARAQLRAVGLDDAAHELPLRRLSGGQRKLAQLAAILLRRSDILFLDEPETHLDFVRRGELEQLIAAFPGAVVLVSHDRYLLDETVDTIAEVDRAHVRVWPGNYSAYVLARELELRRQQERYVTQQKEIARLEDAIRRFRHWAHIVVNERHIRQARVKQRQIDRMDKVERPVLERRKVALALRSAARGGDRVLELSGAGVALGGRQLLEDVDLTVLRGERVGVIGRNGAGKTLLLRLVAGDLDPAEGTRWIGPSIRVGYLPQDADIETDKETPIEVVRDAYPCTEERAVSLLMKFLFTYEQVRRPLETLSGGERTRLQFLLLMLSGGNLLVLDEPTNHLDIDTVEVLESALADYDGTVVFASHDRYLLDRLADQVVHVSDGHVRSFEGGFSFFLDRYGAAVA